MTNWFHSMSTNKWICCFMFIIIRDAGARRYRDLFKHPSTDNRLNLSLKYRRGFIYFVNCNVDSVIPIITRHIMMDPGYTSPVYMS